MLKKTDKKWLRQPRLLSRVYFSRYPANGEFSLRLTVSVLRNSVLIISHITFRDCHVHFFRQPFSIQLYSLVRSSFEQPRSRQTGQPALSYQHNNNFIRKQGMSRGKLKFVFALLALKDSKPQLAGGNQLAIYKRGRGFELGTTENKSSKWPERDLNQGPPDCECDALTTRPRCLLRKMPLH